MAYYNRNCKRLDIPLEKFNYLNNGACGNITYYENIIFKQYFPEIEPYYRLRPQIFDILKTINNRHFVELFDLYKNMSLLDLLKYKLNLLSFTPDAYTAKYYVDEQVNVLYEPVDFLLDNFKELEILFNIFTANSICTLDVKKENTIINNNNIILIDPDLFYISEGPNLVVSIKNKKNLLKLFRSICIASAKKEKDYGFLLEQIYTKLDDICIEENTDVTYEISKKLRYSTKAIDYFIK